MILKTSLTNANLKAFTRLSKLNNKVIFFELNNYYSIAKAEKKSITVRSVKNENVNTHMGVILQEFSLEKKPRATH